MKTFRKEDVVGKTVIETTGAVRGKVDDVTFDLAGTITLLVKGPDGKESQVAIANVTGISEHVVVRADQSPENAGLGTGTRCRFCGAPKSPTERWCPSCGRSQV
jgi:sporulation protein YlmC with PRC-barrel domain